MLVESGESDLCRVEALSAPLPSCGPLIHAPTQVICCGLTHNLSSSFTTKAARLLRYLSSTATTYYYSTFVQPLVQFIFYAPPVLRTPA